MSIYLPTGTNDNSWQTWQKPRGFVMCSIFAIGPGGGGGGGQSGGSTSTRSGGRGGGAGAWSSLIIPLFLLPDTLYIRVGSGGAGGAGNNPGGNGANGTGSTYVAISPSIVTSFQLLFAASGSSGLGGANSGTTSPGGSSSQSDCPLSQLGAALFNSGIFGQAGGTSASPPGVGTEFYYASLGGLGGGGGNTIGTVGNGGGIFTSGSFFTATPGGQTTGFLDGANGFSHASIFPGKFYPGTGGAASNTTTGGRGGAGFFGSGGGGGGAGSPGGAGGRGGDGCVIIQCW